jgi:hypothetical protein
VRGWRLTCGLGKSSGSPVFLGHERSKEFAGGANGRRRWVARACKEVRQGGLKARGLVEAVAR